MRKFTPTRRGNPCVICDDTSGKCREHRDGEIFLCMTYADARLGEIQNGYKCIKVAKAGNWSTFKLDNSQEWTEQQRLEWQAQNQQRRQQQVKEDDQRRQRSLSAVERDKQYRALLAQLTLHPDDRADLVRRGFTQEQVELSGFKSVERYQNLQSSFSDLLPGVTGDGKRLIVSSTGYLCPIRNADGLIVACQVRLRTLPTSESNRYRWLSGNGQTLHLYPDDSDGELPLAVFRPQGKPRGISLAEGTGAKPFLVSQRLNELVIAAAGGQWGSSEATFKRSLDQASLELEGVKKLTIYPDAGDILNSSVMKRWQSVVELLEQWGWSVTFAWWGQVDKSHPDIDEVNNFSSITYIKPDEFWVKGNPTKNQGFDPEPNSTKRTEEPDWKQREKANWRKKRSFTNAIKTASEWCAWKRPGANTISFYKAGLGRGKTTQLKNWVKEWRQTEEVGFLCLGYRNTLLLQLCEQLGFYHLHDKDAPLMKSDPNGGIALCVDSLWRFNPEDFEGKIIILDEVKSVIKHLLHSPTIKNRDKTISLFTEAIRRARQVICLDGLMADWVVDYLHSLAPEKQIIRAENTHQGKKPIINFLLGTVGIEGKLKVNDRSPWFKYLQEGSTIPVICSDSQALIEALDNIFTEQGLDVLRIDSKTVPEDYVKDFLKNCNAYIEKRKPDVMLYTPSAESGVDVSIPDYFTQHFGFFFGVLDVDGILQMLGRIRDDIPKFVWCKSFVSESEGQHSKSSVADTIAKSMNELLISDISTSITDPEAWKEKVLNHLTTVVSNSLQDTSNRVSFLVQSIQNFEKRNLRECLREALLESGYHVRDCTEESSEEYGKEAKQETEAVKRQNASDIFKAEKVAPELVDELKFDARWEEKCKVIQAKLRERLPGIEETPTWTEDFVYHVKYGDRDFISHQEMYWLFKHPEVARYQSQKSLHWMARRLSTFVGNIKSRWARIHALHEMGFERFLDPLAEWTDDSAEVVELVKQGKKHSNALGVHLGTQSNIRYLGNLLKMLGLKLKSRKEGKGKRFYQLNSEILEDSVRVQALTCIEARFTQPEEQLDWKSAINEAHGITAENEPQIQSEQAIQVETRTPQNVYNNEVSPVSRNIDLESQGDREVLAAVPTEDGAKLVELLSLVSTAEAFAAVIEGCSQEAVEDAIASQNTQPKRLQLTEWYAAALAEVIEATAATRPSLEEYQPGAEVWAYFPQSCDKWLKGIVEWVRGNTVKVKSGFLGTFVENPEAIAPGSWVVT